MDFRTVRLEEVASTTRNPVIPQEGVKYWHYSLPSFDTGRKPIKEDGGEILSSKLLVRKGDILCNKLNMRFRRIWRIDEELPNSICSTEFIPLQAKQINRDYLYYILISDDFTSTMTSMRFGTSGSHQRVKPEQLLSYEFKIPDESQQERIANILVAIDQKIELNNQINDYLEELLDAKFDKTLEAADSWNEASLLDIANYKNGLAMQKFRPEQGDLGLPVLKIRELGQGSCGADSERCRSDIDEAVTVHDGDLVFSWSGTLLLDYWAGGDVGLNQHLFKVTSDVYPSWFYYMWTKYHLRKFIAMAKDRATTMGHIKRSALADSKVLIPSQASLDELTGSMQPIADLIIVNKVESRKLGELRDALLPKLMSGEIDVSQVELPTQLNNHLFEN